MYSLRQLVIREVERPPSICIIHIFQAVPRIRLLLFQCQINLKKGRWVCLYWLIAISEYPYFGCECGDCQG